jgi:hypothetical protein
MDPHGGPIERPRQRVKLSAEGCEAFAFTAVVAFADAGNGRTHDKAVALHKDVADCDIHAAMRFEKGWATVAAQLDEFAASLRVGA